MRLIKVIALIFCLTSIYSCDERKEEYLPNTSVEKKVKPKDQHTIIGEKNFLHGYEAKTETGNINVVIEIPTGSIDKWEVDKNDGSLKWQILESGPRKINYLGYPGNYGMIPKTYLPKELGGDGDPLDVIVLGPAVERGSIVECKIIGVIELLDKGEQDDKLIAVMKNTSFYKINNIQELKQNYSGALNIVSTWFKNYKGVGKIKIQKVAEKERAKEILEASIKAYNTANK